MTAQYITVSPHSLRLDRQNPRLAQYDLSDVQTEDKLTTFIYEYLAGKNLAASITAGGYFPQEPLTVTHEHGHTVVLDGNRRVAALRTLINTSAPELPPDIRDSLQEIPAYVTDRESHWRHALKTHVQPPLAWSTYARGHFIQKLHQDRHITPEQITAQVFNRQSEPAYYMESIQVLQQAEATQPFHRNQVHTHFSITWLHSALKEPNIREFIGLTRTPLFKENPVPAEKQENLAELLGWLYGTAPSQPNIVHNHDNDLSDLNRILAHPKALEQLRETRKIHPATELIGTPETKLENALWKARQELHRAGAALADAKNVSPHLLGQAREIAVMADDLHNQPRKR